MRFSIMGFIFSLALHLFKNKSLDIHYIVMLYYHCTYIGAMIILEENMEKYLDKKPKTSLSKSDVAAYVHDMKELEIKHYTLNIGTLKTFC